MSVVNDAIEFLEDLIMGDFKENPSNMSIIANAVIGLIPIADQVLDVRDVAGMVCRIAKNGPANCTVDDWVDLSFAAIGCIPEVGSLFKGVFKPLWKSRKVVKKIDAKTWSSIDRMLGMSKGSSIKYLKAFPWAKRKAEALQQLNDAFVGLDQLLAFLSEPRWWVPDNLELLARKMRPLVKQVREPIKKGFDLGFKAMQDFVIDMIGEEGYKVVKAAATIALSTGNNPKNKHEKSKVKLVNSNSKSQKTGKTTASKSTAKQSTTSKIPDKKVTQQKTTKQTDQKKQGTDHKVDAKKVEADKKKAEVKKRADHDKVNGNERQNVEKGKGTQTNATKKTLRELPQFNNILGFMSEHIVDYFCATEFKWGTDWAKHDEGVNGKWLKGLPNSTNVGKLNNRKRKQSLLSIVDVNGQGIDSVWRVSESNAHNNFKKYAIVEAKSSKKTTQPKTSNKPSVVSKLGINDSLSDLLDPPTDTSNNKTSVVKKGKKAGKNKSTNSTSNKSTKNTNQQKGAGGTVIVQMSREWIEQNLLSAVGDPTLKRSILLSYSRHLFYTPLYLESMIQHEKALLSVIGQSWPLKLPDPSLHTNHSIPNQYRHDENEVKAAVNTKKDRLRIKFGNLKSLDKE